MCQEMQMGISPEMSKLRLQLRAAVQSIKWTYSAFWQLSNSKEGLVWGGGYYNGHIKTRKTVQAAELSQEELGMQRTRQLRDLYETLSSSGDNNQATNRRLSAALTPEDLTETEWFYMLCMSCSFAIGTGMPGQALAKGSYVWLEKANETSTETFTRSILAKTAHIKTVLCIPIAEGVAEFGSTEHFAEDPVLVQHIRTYFAEPLKPVGSEQSTSNPKTPEERSSSGLQEAPSVNGSFGGPSSWLSFSKPSTHQQEHSLRAFPQEVQLDISNRNHVHCQREDGSPKTWAILQDPGIDDQDGGDMQGPSPNLLAGLRPTTEMSLHSLRLPQLLEDGQYQEECEESGISAFIAWKMTSAPPRAHPAAGSQWMLKNALFHITHLYSVHNDQIHRSKDLESSLAGIDNKSRAAQRKPSGGQEDLNVSHVLAERRRREKLNDRFMSLRALVPFVTKMDKASILGDAIEYLKQLQKRIIDLEARNKQLQSAAKQYVGEEQGNLRPKLSLSESFNRLQTGIRSPTNGGIQESNPYSEGDFADMVTSDYVQQDSRSSLSLDKEEAAFSNSPSDDSEATHAKRLEGPADWKVSLVEDEAVLELQCLWRRNALINVLKRLNELPLEVYVVQASTTNGMLNTACKAKVQDSSRLTEADLQSALQQTAFSCETKSAPFHF